MWIAVFHYKLAAFVTSYTVFSLFSLYFIYYFVFRIFNAVFMYVLLYFVYVWPYPVYVLLYFVYVLTFMAIFAWFDKTCDFSFISKGLRSGGIPLYRSSQLYNILRNDEFVKNLVSFSLATLCSFNSMLSSKLSLPPWFIAILLFIYKFQRIFLD